MFRPPSIKDAKKIWELIGRFKPLDINSPYCYALIGRDFFDSSIVYEEEGRIKGVVIGYLRPRAPERLFVWQVAIEAKSRGKGIAKRAIEAILKNLERKGHCIQAIEATYTPSNLASKALFHALGREWKVVWIEENFLEGALLSAQEAHEEEWLITLPFSSEALGVQGVNHANL